MERAQLFALADGALLVALSLAALLVAAFRADERAWARPWVAASALPAALGAVCLAAPGRAAEWLAPGTGAAEWIVAGSVSLALAAGCAVVGALGLARARAVLAKAASPVAALPLPGSVDAQLGRVLDLGLVRRLRIAVEDRRLRAWQAENPGADFAAYYAGAIERSLAAGQPHRSLGTLAWSRRSLLRSRGEWSADAFVQRGAKHFRELREAGLEAHHRCVDYGCGSLRVGQHLIRFLEPGHYVGLDVTDRFFRDGLELLEPGLVEERRPHLAVIDESELAALERRPPDFLVSVAVVMHVPPSELDVFFARLLRAVGPGTRALLYVDVAPRTMRTAPKSWAHEPELLMDRVRERSESVRLELREGKRIGRLGGTSWRRAVLTVSHRQPAARPAPAIRAEGA